MDGKQLKNSILQWAIQGKLVAQDPNEEPAAELVKRINPKATIVFECIEYGKVPHGWCLVKGKHIFMPMRSTKPSGVTFQYIDIDSIDNTRQKIKEAKTIKAVNAPSRAKRYTQKGDIVFSMVRPYLRNIAKVETDNCIASTGFYVCSPMKMLDSVFCYYLMISDYVVNGLNKYMKGENSPSINIGVIDEWLFPIPPLSEQRRICNKLQEVLPAADKYGMLQRKLEALDMEVFINLRKSVLQEAIQGKLVAQDPNDEPAAELLKRIRNEKARLVKEKKIKPDKNETVIYREGGSYYEKSLATGEANCIDDEIPFEIPKGWEWARLGFVVNHSPQVVCDDNTEVAFIPMTLIDGGYGSSYSFEKRYWKTVKSGFTKIHTGDIAYAKITPCFQNRKSFILGDVPGNTAAATTELNVMRIYCDTFVPFYLLYFLKSEYFIKEAEYKGTAGQQRVKIDYIKSKLIPIPPYQEQQRICNKLQEVLPVIDYNAPENLGRLIR